MYQPVLTMLTKRHTFFLADIHRSSLEGDMFMVKWKSFFSYVNIQFFLFFNNDILPYKITYLDCSFSSLLLLCKNAPLFMWQCSQCECLNFSFVLLSTHHYIFTKSESFITLFEKYLVISLKIKEIIFL